MLWLWTCSSEHVSMCPALSGAGGHRHKDCNVWGLSISMSSGRIWGCEVFALAQSSFLAFSAYFDIVEIMVICYLNPFCTQRVLPVGSMCRLCGSQSLGPTCLLSNQTDQRRELCSTNLFWVLDPFFGIRMVERMFLLILYVTGIVFLEDTKEQLPRN